MADKSNALGFFLIFLGTFLAFKFLLQESLDFTAPEFPEKRKSLIEIGAAFLIMEIMSVIVMLPLGFLDSAALMILFIFILEDLIFHHTKGSLNRQIILNNIAILVIAIIFIFSTSRWTL